MNENSQINAKKQELLFYSSIISTILIGSLIVSLILNYNAQLEVKGEIPFWTTEEAKNVALILKIVTFLVILFSIYVAYENYKLLVETNSEPNDIDSAFLEIIVSIIATIGAAIVIYAVSISSEDGDISNILNPEL